jgi:hypothetical protein
VTTATAPDAPVEVETLPDGRELRVLADGSVLVAGVAQARPHPVPGVDWISRTPSAPRARRRVATTRAPRTAVERTLARYRIVDDARSVARAAAHARARTLLLSLLDADQRADYERTKTFWVDVPQGRLQFGRLYSIRFEPRGTNTVQILCVVPKRHHELPGPDIWANLLLAVRDDPDRFFAVAVNRGGTADGAGRA